MQLEIMLWGPKSLNWSPTGDKSFFLEDFTLLKKSVEEKLVQVRYYMHMYHEMRIPFTKLHTRPPCLLHHSVRAWYQYFIGLQHRGKSHDHICSWASIYISNFDDQTLHAQTGNQFFGFIYLSSAATLTKKL